MPNGYTATINSTTNLRDFAHTCARAFGALILMRDAPAGTPIPEKLEPSTHHLDQITSLEAHRASVIAMTDDEATAAASQYQRDRAAAAAKRKADDAERRANYERVLAEVLAWEVPEALKNLKAFMEQQIRDSLSWDCDPVPELEAAEAVAAAAPPLTGIEWRSMQLKHVEDAIAYHQRAHGEEVQRTNERNDWLAHFHAALPPAKPAA